MTDDATPAAQAETSDAFTVEGASITVTASGHTDRGAVRRLNEDSYLSAAPIFVVADGMGGHAHGDRASRTAVASFAETFAGGTAATPTLVLDAIRTANTRIITLAASEGDGSSLSGTTLTGVALVQIGDAGQFHWMAFNVGDSRVYRWDGRSLTQLSVDHSAVQELVDAGRITRAEADVHPARNVVTRALGADALVDPDVWILPAVGHQRFLVCSDGLTRELSDDEIARIIVFHDSQSAIERTGEHSRTLAERLVLAAVAAGGSDNVTAVAVESLVASSVNDSDETVDRYGFARVLEETLPRA